MINFMMIHLINEYKQTNKIKNKRFWVKKAGRNHRRSRKTGTPLVNLQTPSDNRNMTINSETEIPVDYRFESYPFSRDPLNLIRDFPEFHRRFELEALALDPCYIVRCDISKNAKNIIETNQKLDGTFCSNIV